MTWSHHVWDQGVVLTPVAFATLATEDGTLHAGWIPAHAADLADDYVKIRGRVFTVVALGPPVPHPTNSLPRWAATRWADPADPYDGEDRPCD